MRHALLEFGRIVGCGLLAAIFLAGALYLAIALGIVPGMRLA